MAVVVLLTIPVFASLPVYAVSSPTAPAVPTLRGYKLTGEAPADLPILMTLALPLRNVGALDSMVVQVSDPSSPMYRHFLSPQQVKSEFLPTAAFDSLLSYVKANGLRVELTALDSEIVVEGTVSQFKSALGASVETYANGTLTYYASTGASTFGGAYLYASNATLLFTKPAVQQPPRTSSNVTFTSGTFSMKQLQPVYNASYLYSRGDDGKGQTIGLLDYYGSPTITSDLGIFDRTFGFPNATLNVIPIGPYDPNLGVNVGWSTEVSLDVESSHAMAPGAAIDLYVSNGALPVSVALAKIVEDDKVTSLSQSFGTPEWYYSVSSLLGGPSFFTLNSIIPDQYYALGSLEGISFLSSTGDGGGSGFSAGPQGDSEYPATSPFVTSVGGTQTYFANSSGGQGFTQTAWSNIGFVPNGVNEGGGGGGVSILEPKPWYQSKQATPPSFPNGRLNPDLSLQAGIDPATEIVDGGKIIGEGGTSESSPLLAGLLTLVAESVNGSLGLINPFLYQVGDNPAQYREGFSPITYGYIIPWSASYGYNLATGWGAPNVGGLASLLSKGTTQQALEIRGELFNKTGLGQIEYTPGQLMNVSARISSAGVPVTSGSFTISLATLAGTSSPAPMKYTPTTGNWTGSILVGQESGLTYLYLTGSSNGVSGQGVGEVFTGYLGSITATGYIYVLPTDPWTWSESSPLNLTVATSDLFGKPEPAGAVALEVQPYSISTNSYSNSSATILNGNGLGTVTGYLTTPAPAGPVLLALRGGTYGYAPTVYGIYLQSSYIYPDVAAEPGSVAPGQYLTVIANPIAPVNVYFQTSAETGREFAYDVYVGSNVTASLVTPTRTTVSTADLSYQPCAQALRVCNGGANALYGQLLVPTGTAPGLYTILLHASYGSLTPGGNLTGNFFGQIWVSSSELKPIVTVEPGPSSAVTSSSNATVLYEGQQAHVRAYIRYSNGTAVSFGEFSAVVYPKSLEGQYATLMHTQYASGQLVSLTFDPATGAWLGDLTLPGPANQGALGGINLNSLDYSGPYEVYVTGISADGAPTTSVLSAEGPFFIQPYVYTAGVVTSTSQGSKLAFVDATVRVKGSLVGDVFVGSNTIENTTLTVEDSQIRGNLSISNSNITLVGVSGGNIRLNSGSLTLKDSTVDTLSVVGGKVTILDSSYGKVTPALPVITVSGLSKPLGGVSKYSVTAAGSGLSNSSLSVLVDGTAASTSVDSNSTGLTATGSIDAAALNDGVHTLTVTATQSDGLSSTYSVSFATDAHQLSLANQTTLLFVLAAVVAAVSVIALVLGYAAYRRGRTSPQV